VLSFALDSGVAAMLLPRGGAPPIAHPCASMAAVVRSFRIGARHSIARLMACRYG
jgi:hypothetical protein